MAWHRATSKQERLRSAQGAVVKLPRAQSILVVDDFLDIDVTFRQALSKHGYTVFGFSDPVLAHEHFKLNSKG